MPTTVASPLMIAQFGADITGTGSDGATALLQLRLLANTLPSDGTKMFHNAYTIANAANQQLDLSGTLVDFFGNAVVFTKVYGFIVVNSETLTGRNVEVGNSNFAAWLGTATDKIIVGPSGFLALSSPVDGYTVTNTSADIFKVNNPGANSATVKVLIFGK